MGSRLRPGSPVLRRSKLEIAKAVAPRIREPEPVDEPRRWLAVAAGREADRKGTIADWKFGDRAIRGGPAELVAARVPDIPIRSDRYIDRGGTRFGHRILADRSLHRDPAEAIAVSLETIHSPGELDEPHRAVCTRRDVARARGGSRQLELGHATRSCDPADLVGAV